LTSKLSPGWVGKERRTDAGRIGTDPAGAEVTDGEGGVLLPGLIDAHVHLKDRDTLARLAAAGVTTALDMGCGPPELVASLRGVAGLTDIRSAGTPAIAPGSLHARSACSPMCRWTGRWMRPRRPAPGPTAVS
jgi:cytosine/adenosine deaminase-related metal-dependent hydrolase